MPKVILIGSQQCQWDIGGSMKPGGVPLELTDVEMKKHSDVIAEVLDKPKELSEEEKLFKLNKDEQIKMLQELGVKKIPRFEKDRVKAIIEARGVKK